MFLGDAEGEKGKWMQFYPRGSYGLRFSIPLVSVMGFGGPLLAQGGPATLGAALPKPVAVVSALPSPATPAPAHWTADPSPTPTLDIQAHLRQMEEQNNKTREALEALQKDYEEKVQTIDTLAEKEKLVVDFRRRLLARKMSDVKQVLKTVSIGCAAAETYLRGMDLYRKQADIANPWSDPDISNFFDGLGDWGSFAGLTGATASSLEKDDSTRQTLLVSGLALFGVSKLTDSLFGSKFNDKVKYLQFSRDVFQALHSAKENYEAYQKHVEALSALASKLNSDEAFNAAFPLDGGGSVDEKRISAAITEDYLESVLELAKDYNGAVDDLTNLFRPVVLKEEDSRDFSLLPTEVQLRVKDVEDSYGQFKESFDSQWRWKLEIQPEVLRTLGTSINWQ